MAVDMCIDTGDDALSGCFFVAGGSIYLSGKEQVLIFFVSNVCLSWVGSKKSYSIA